jgi:hypothetical protein
MPTPYQALFFKGSALHDGDTDAEWTCQQEYRVDGLPMTRMQGELSARITQQLAAHKCILMDMGLTRRVAIGIGGVYKGLLLLVHAQQRTALIHCWRVRGLP